MKPKHRRTVILILINIIIILLANDALLYWIDPLGVVAASHENHARHQHLIDHPTGYAIEPGLHRWHYYNVTILEDYSRDVPDTNSEANCTIATIGDSVTFGNWVNDAETWVNLLAMANQNVHFINTARGDYSAPNIAALKAETKADGYVWLIISNDALIPYQYVYNPPAYWYPPATKLYLHWIMNRHSTFINRETDYNLYWQSVEQIATNDTLIFGFDNDPLAIETLERYPVHLIIDPVQHDVSFVDGHPNAQGHIEIYQQISPYMSEFIQSVCDITA